MVLEGMKMSQKQLVADRSFVSENGRRGRLRYYLLSESGGLCDAFGAEVVLIRRRERQSAAVRRFTTSRSRMEDILRLLARNTVTPCTFREIMKDISRKS